MIAPVVVASIAFLVVTATPDDRLAHGQALLDALEYDAAGDDLEALATDDTAPDAIRLRAHLLAGIAHRIAGKDTDANLDFRYVLLRAPTTTLPADSPPKVRVFFDAIRQDLALERPSNPPPLLSASPASTTTPTTTSTTNASSAPIAAGVVCGVGAVAAIAGVVGVVYAESALMDPTGTAADRKAQQGVGQWSTVGVALGVVVAAAGGIAFAVLP